MISDDDRPVKKPAAVPGEPLDTLSVDELHARVAIYEVEIARLRRDIEAKEKHKQAADAFFRR